MYEPDSQRRRFLLRMRYQLKKAGLGEDFNLPASNVL
jgi:hypothetical protein